MRMVRDLARLSFWDYLFGFDLCGADKQLFEGFFQIVFISYMWWLLAFSLF